MPDSAAIRSQCERVLRGNWLEGRSSDGLDFAYTSPSLEHYPWQWYWDSCFAAIAWRHIDPERPERELRSLLAAQRPDGFIGHTIFWNMPLRGPRRFTYNVTPGDTSMTSSIQPPVLAWAWQLAVGDPSMVPEIRRHHEWLEHHRDLDGDGLIWIVQPDESGLDASPQFDPIWGSRTHGMPGFIALVRRNRRLEFDLRRIVADGGPACAEIATNVLYSLSRTALGLPSLTETLLERCYDERRGLFMPLCRPAPGASIPVTWAALAPLALPDLPEDVGRRLVEEHLLDRQQFWLPAGIPSVSMSEPAFQTMDRGPVFGQPRRYWRGPVWINATWLLWRGLVRLGYREAASELSDRVAKTIARNGLREYYEPFTGAGLGQHHFAWSTLVMEMLEPAAATR